MRKSNDEYAIELKRCPNCEWQKETNKEYCPACRENSDMHRLERVVLKFEPGKQNSSPELS